MLICTCRHGMHKLYVCRYDQAKMRTHLIECFRAQKMKKISFKRNTSTAETFGSKNCFSVVCVQAATIS